ncbi:MAG: UvrD-helicase domain-containing protein [Gaiellales bacterium]
MSATLPPPALSDEQRRAVEAPAGAFVDAGAGSGKTTVLVERYMRALTERNLAPQSILAVTFPRRAAGEMRQRIRSRLRHEGLDRLIPLVEGGWIDTIHATCQKLLAEFPDEAGLVRGLRVADTVETALLREAAFERALAATLAEHGDAAMLLLTGYGSGQLRAVALGLLDGARMRGAAPAAPTGTATRELLALELAALREAAAEMAEAGTDSDRAIQRRRAAADLLDLLGRDPEPMEVADLGEYARGEKAYTAQIADVERTARDVVARELHEPLQHLVDGLAAAYEAVKDEAGALDYDDLQLRTRRMLEEHPAVRDQLRERFREVMVDEFQDTDALQVAILELLRDPATPLLCVGDEQQAIYGFRGAEIEVFRRFREAVAAGDGPMEMISLDRNHRSVPPVLDAVNAVFAGDDRFAHRPLAAARDPRDAVPAVEFLVGVGERLDDGRANEAALVARRLRDLVDAGACRPGGVAVLFRAGTSAPVFEAALRAVDLPTVSSAGRAFLRRQPVMDVMALLRVLWNRDDDLALLTCLASPMAGLSNDGLALLRDATKWEFSAALQGVGAVPLKEDDMARALAFGEALERLRARTGRSGLGDLVAAAVDETRYDLAVLALPDGAERMANLAKLERVARSFEDARGPDLPGFVRAVESGRLDTGVRSDGVTASEDDDAVRLMTIHQAKGLEFPVVVLADTGGRPRADVPAALVGDAGAVGALVPVATGEPRPTRAHEDLLRDLRDREAREALRVAYVAWTRAEDRLIVSGACTEKGGAQSGSLLAWALERLGDDGGTGERLIESGAARVRLEAVDEHVGPDAGPPVREDTIELVLDDSDAQFAFDVDAAAALDVAGGATPLASLPALPDVGAWTAPTLSYSALDQHARCPYRFHVERMLGIPAPEAGGGAAVGKAVHAAIETGADPAALLSAAAEADEAALGEARDAGARWQASPLAARMAALAGTAHEQPFLLRLGPAVVTGFYDLVADDGEGLVIGDVKVGSLGELSPEERRDAGYVVQEEVYALAALEAGHAHVDVCFQWVGDDASAERMAERRFSPADAAPLRERLEARVSAALEGPWPATPSPTACAGCPALGMLCTGPESERR